MTNYDGRCRGGWAFGQGFDSPQVHRKRGLRVYSQASFSMDWGVCMHKDEGSGFRQGAQGASGTCSARTEPGGETDSPQVHKEGSDRA